MSSGTRSASRLTYIGTLAMLVLALAFPISLMIFNPTLMFERGWEQFVGTGIYFWAVFTLAFELRRLWKDERGFDDAPALVEAAVHGGSIDPDDARILPARVRQLAAAGVGSHHAGTASLMELNREGSSLDQEHAAGRFTLPRYILYLLPVIGFIGTVEGISKALMNISKVLPMVKDLDGFMSNLTSVTSALQVAFDSTLLALFLSAALMLVLTLLQRRSEDLLARVDRWVVEHLLVRLSAGETTDAAAAVAEALGPQLERIDQALRALAEHLGGGLGPHVERFATAVDRLPSAAAGFQRGADAIGRLGEDLGSLGSAGEALRKGVTTLSRIEANLSSRDAGPDQLDEIRRGLDRACLAIEGLAQSWSAAYERSSRTTQEQLARTMGNLKDALDLLQVSMEQGNTLYRSIVKKMFDAESGVRAA